MVWINDIFFYSVGMLKGIAEHYESLYTDGSLAVLYTIAESKSDFDSALDNIGRGNWKGLTHNNFGAYKYYGAFQQMIIAVILGITDNLGTGDYHLEAYGFYEIPQLRGSAYSRMVKFLNETQSYDIKREDTQS